MMLGKHRVSSSGRQLDLCDYSRKPEGRQAQLRIGGNKGKWVRADRTADLECRDQA